MLRVILATSALALTTACATTELDPIDPAAFVAATPIEDDTNYPVEIVETAVALPLPGQMRAIEAAEPAPRLSPAQAIREGRTSALIEPSVDGYVNAIQVYPYTEGALYRLYASPGQVSDVALQPGEELVKPISSGIRTNLMIATDRRTYHLELESVEGGYMAALSC